MNGMFALDNIINWKPKTNKPKEVERKQKVQKEIEKEKNITYEKDCKK